MARENGGRGKMSGTGWHIETIPYQDRYYAGQGKKKRKSSGKKPKRVEHHGFYDLMIW